VWQNVTDGGEGVKKIEKSADVVYGWPLSCHIKCQLLCLKSFVQLEP